MRESQPLGKTDDRRARHAATVLLLALIGLLAPIAPPALATPAQSWLDLTEVQALLDGSPDGVPGHFVTVLGGPTVGKQAPVDIPLSILSVVPGAGPAGALLLVRLDLSDPSMARIGNIAAGMSGSPVFVDSGGDKLVGALSYGDDFTTGGLALATPIKHMIAVEGAGLVPSAVERGSAAPRPIEPIRVAGRTISRVVVDSPSASDRSKARTTPSAEAGDGTARFTPLLGMQIGGLPSQSAAYRRLANNAQRHGLRVLTPHGGGFAGSPDDFRTAVVPGASAGTFFSVGDLPFGAVGTVTYTTADGSALAFGHPLMWSGPSGAFFTNAWIDGVWSSSLGSYKLGSPGAVRGTLVQDRAAGVGARLDQIPEAVPVTASATVTAGGRPPVTSKTLTTIAPFAFGTWMRSDLPAAAAIQPVLRAADAELMPGSATTEMTITVSDGSHEYPIHRTNMYDDGDDVLGLTGSDVYWSLETILSNPNGTTPAIVKAVELKSQVTSTRRRATIVGITSPGLRPGRNIVTVAVRPYGSTATKLVPVTLDIPAGTPLTGVVTASAGGDLEDLPEGTSIAERVASISDAPTNSDVVVGLGTEDSEQPSVRGMAHTTYVIDGYGEAVTSETTVEPSDNPIVAGQEVTLSGSVEPAAQTGTVKVERRTVGSPAWRTLDPAAELTVEDDVAAFAVTDRPTLSSIYRVTYAGSDGGVLGSSASVGVAVRGRVTLRGARTKSGIALTAAVYPRAAGSTITFQRLWRGKWRNIKVVKTGQTGQARYVWAPRKGSYRVRALLTRTTTLAGNVSPTIRVSR